MHRPLSTPYGAYSISNAGSSTPMVQLFAPNSRLKMSMQWLPHDGVAAPADSAATEPTPPTRVSVAAAAKTLLLMDMDSSSLEPQSYPAYDCRATTAPRQANRAECLVTLRWDRDG